MSEEKTQADELKELADEMVSIINQLWRVTDDMPMTRKQSGDFEVIKERLWNIQSKMRLVAMELPNE